MAAGDYTPSRFGSSNNNANSAGNQDLFLKIFGAEVLNCFLNNTVMQGRHRMRHIAAGKSAQFPGLGTISAAYHTPGAIMTGSTVNSAERVILVDQLLKAEVSVANIDELMSQFDVRGPYAALLGDTLGIQFDAFALRAVLRAARTRSVVAPPTPAVLGTPTEWTSGEVMNVRSGTSGAVNATGAALTSAATAAGFGEDSSGDGFYRVTDNPVLGVANANTYSTMTPLAASGNATNAGILANAIWKAAEVLDVKNVPASSRYCALRPTQFYMLLSNPSSGSSTPPVVIHKDYAGNAGTLANGTIGEFAGFQVVKTNQLPNSDLKTDNRSQTTGGNSYALNCIGTVAACWHESAVGTVSLADIALESEYSVARQGTLFVAKYVRGTNTLRPECAVEIVDGSSTTGVGAASTAGPLGQGTADVNQTRAHILPN